jgi:3,4-dihydroxyphenylacetate 2,3-dioxygenase
MAGGVIRGVVAPHVPRIGIEAKAPPFLRGVIAGLHAMGKEVRAAKPDLIVLLSSHFVSTFNWQVTMQAEHKGMCLAEEAPDLIPGVPYHRKGDPEFAEALFKEIQVVAVPVVRNESPYYSWDYATYVPLNYLDPEQRIPVVVMPSVLAASLEECFSVGGAVRNAAVATGKKVVFVASCSFSHKLARGQGLWPAEHSQKLDRDFIALLCEGRITDAKAGFAEYAHAVTTEQGGRPLATMLGSLDDKSGERFTGMMYGSYGPSSGSGNACVSIRPASQPAISV